MKIMRKILLLLPLVTLVASCEVEFSPNAEWKNIPVVYCVLDQDDDTTWVRVQRCYMSEGNIYDYGQVSDSINYPQGSITVSLLGYENGVVKDSMDFQYYQRDCDSGNFASSAQPVYGFETRNRLKEKYTYVLKVRNAADGRILAYTEPVSLIKKTEETLLSKPVVHTNQGDTNFSISGMKFNSTVVSGSCEIQWKPLENARLYQPMVRMYYVSQGQTKHVDLYCPTATSKTNTVYYNRSQFLTDVKAKLETDTTRKKYSARVDIYLYCCTEDLNVYLSNASNTAIDAQSLGMFNNIHGGIGVFAARRTHLYKHMNSDDSMTPNRGLLWFLIDLGVGFY